MHETWQELCCYLAPPLLWCALDYICEANLRGCRHNIHMHAFLSSQVPSPTCIHAFMNTGTCDKCICLCILSERFVSGDYIFLTSHPWCQIVSRFAGSACRAWRWLAKEVEWAARWVIDEAAFAWDSHSVDQHNYETEGLTRLCTWRG